ncbi:MAG: hypothetical protein IR153_03025 [Flavobacterium sp.]|nr:hypothetical protein [Flavobacterium sp.]
MKENFKTINQALDAAGFKPALEDAAGNRLDFKFTAYSLNSKLSFRFENLEEFTEFLNTAGFPVDEARMTQINSAFIEMNLNPDSFFYVNFFERGKEEDM